MAASESVTVTILNDEGESSEVTIRFASFQYPSAEHARLAWEKAKRRASGGVSVWRMFEPQEPPFRHFIVIVAGELAADVKKTVRVLTGMPGVAPYEVEQRMKEALALRRVRVAVESVERQFRGGIDGSRRLGGLTVIRTPSGSILQSDGSLELKDKPRG
jgi:hypothetical protein